MGLSPEFEQEVLDVKKLGDRIGYGNLMELASALWRHDLRKHNASVCGAFVPVISYWPLTEERICYDRYVSLVLDKKGEM